MTRDQESKLLVFCVDQFSAFRREAWLSADEKDRPVLATVALFLAGFEWYPHHAELTAVAELLQPGCSGHFSSMVAQTNFECSRFASMLHRHLEHESAHA